MEIDPTMRSLHPYCKPSDSLAVFQYYSHDDDDDNDIVRYFYAVRCRTCAREIWNGPSTICTTLSSDCD